MTLPDLHEGFQDLAARLPAPPELSVDVVRQRAARRQRRRTSRTLVVAVVAAALAVVAVSAWWPTSSPDPVIDPTPNTDTELSLTPGDNYTILGALAEVPAEMVADTPLIVLTANVESLAARSGIQLPVEHDDADAVQRWFDRLQGGTDQAAGPFVPLLRNWGVGLTDHAGVFEDLGWSWLDVTAFVDVNVASGLGQPPLAPFGRYTVATTANTVTFPQSATRLDVDVVQIGTTSGNLSENSPARPRGEALFMAALDRTLVAAGREQDARAWLASGPTLADDASLAAVAAFLDDVGALTARLGRANFASASLPSSYDAVAIGEHDVDGQPVITIAHHFPDTDASEQVEGLRRMWESLQYPTGTPPRLEIIDSGNSGSVAWLTARPDTPVAIGLIQNALLSGWEPFAF